MKLLAVAVLALGGFVIWFNLNTTPRGWLAVGVAVATVVAAQALWKRPRRSA